MADTNEQWIGAALQPVPAAVRVAARPIVEGMGFELVGVELARAGGRPILWVYIDAEAGVSIQDCVAVSGEVSAALDVADPLPQAYELRISSPGLDRPLMRARDFARHGGERAQVQLDAPLEGRRKFSGELLGLTDAGCLAIRCDDGVHAIPLDRVKRAHLEIDPSAALRAAKKSRKAAKKGPRPSTSNT